MVEFGNPMSEELIAVFTRMGFFVLIQPKPSLFYVLKMSSGVLGSFGFSIQLLPLSKTSRATT